MFFFVFFLKFEKVEKTEKLELSPQNFRYDVLHRLYSESTATLCTIYVHPHCVSIIYSLHIV